MLLSPVDLQFNLWQVVADFFAGAATGSLAQLLA